MFSKEHECIIPLMQYLRDHSPDTLTSVNIFINATGMTVTTTHKSADDLKIDGISMRNIKDEWITSSEIKLGSDQEVIK
jgi:hypothetical protein